MMEVREVLRRLAAGQSLREIARTTGLDRKTVRRYAEAAAQSGVHDSDAELGEALDRQRSGFTHCSRPRS